MGLHFYRDPDEIDAEQAAAKLDRAAAQRRSAIRREPSIRPGRESSPATGLSNIIRNRHELRQARVRAHQDSMDSDSQIEILEAELERLRRLRARNSPRPNGQTRTRLTRHLEDLVNASADTVTPHDVFLTQSHEDAILHDSSPSDHVLLPRPTRESNLRFELASATNRTASPHSQPFLPSPPDSLSEVPRNRPVDGPIDTWETTPPLSQDFAPARAARAAIGREQSPTLADAEVEARQGVETPPPEAWEASYPPLRRVPHMSPRPLPRAIVDGLGDRHRSPSPVSETQEEQTWNHLLATMDNNTQIPSTSTSFASITDLLADSQSTSLRSSNTQNTSTSFGEIGVSSEDSCDLPPGITEQDVRRIRERHQRSGRRVIAPRRPVFEDAPRYDEEDRGQPDAPVNDRVLRPLHRGEPPLAVLLREARESRERRQRRRDELTMLQAIAGRQRDHEQIPEEWWALAGLPESLARPSSERRDL